MATRRAKEGPKRRRKKVTVELEEPLHERQTVRVEKPRKYALLEKEWKGKQRLQSIEVAKLECIGFELPNSDWEQSFIERAVTKWNTRKFLSVNEWDRLEQIVSEKWTRIENQN